MFWLINSKLTYGAWWKFITERSSTRQRHYLKTGFNSEILFAWAWNDRRMQYIDCNFAPPTLRRNIGILGLLQKRVLGKTHVIYQRLLPFVHDVFGFLREGEHNKQLYSHCLEIHYQQELWKRSIFCMTDVYNRLPQHVIDIPNVSNFQTALTHIARTACQNGNAEWQSTFSSK